MRLENGTIRHLRRSINLPGHAHELTFSCYRGLALLSKDRTRQWLIEALDLARSIHHLDIWAYVVMPEHAHVLLVPQEVEYEMAAILKTIKQSVSRCAIHFLRTHATHDQPLPMDSARKLEDWVARADHVFTHNASKIADFLNVSGDKQ